MSGFSNWRSSGDAEEPAPDGSPASVAAALTRLLPARRTPSALDRMREEQVAYTGSGSGTVSIYMDFSDLMPGRVDGPFYTGIQGRAAICLQLGPQWSTSLDDLTVIADEGATLHVMTWTDGYPLLRAVIEFPRRLDLYFESMLELTEGNVQEFVIDAVISETVELHLTVAGDSREFPLACRAPRLRQVLGTAVDALCREDHAAEPGQVHAASNRARAAYPSVNGGLSASTAIPLEPVGTVERYAKVELKS